MQDITLEIRAANSSDMTGASNKAQVAFTPDLGDEDVQKITNFLEGRAAFDDLLYFEGNIPNWHAIVESPDYYPGNQEKPLISRGAQVSANLIQPPQDMTHIMIGPATRSDKDLIVTDAASSADHSIKRIIICDISAEALDIAEKDIKAHFAERVGQVNSPEIVRIHGDAFDLAQSFPIIGTALVTSFGLTFDNGFTKDEVRKSEMVYAVSRRYKALSDNLPKGSHVITTHDHYNPSNPNASLKRERMLAAYTGDVHEAFVMSAAKHYLGIDRPQDYLSYGVEIDDRSGLVSRFFRVTNPFVSIVNGRAFTFKRQDIHKSGSSLKMTEDQTVACHSLARMKREEFPIVRDITGLAYHHNIVG